MREVIREIEVVVDIEEVRKVGEKDKKKKGVVDEKAAKWRAEKVSYGEKKS